MLRVPLVDAGSGKAADNRIGKRTATRIRSRKKKTRPDPSKKRKGNKETNGGNSDDSQQESNDKPDPPDSQAQRSNP